MSTSWKITCKKCGHEEHVRTPKTSDGAQGEQQMAESRSRQPCPECKSTDRELSH